MEVTLIRHTSVDVPSGICYGQTDVDLKESFEHESATVKQQLAGINFSKVYTSPLSRCTRLATTCGYADAQRDDRLMELNFGAWEMQRWEDIKDPTLQQWFDDYLNVPATGGESFMQQYQRVSSFLDQLKSTNHERVAIFAHGGVLICAQIYAGTITIEEAFSALTPYGGIVRIEISPTP